MGKKDKLSEDFNDEVGYIGCDPAFDKCQSLMVIEKVWKKLCSAATIKAADDRYFYYKKDIRLREREARWKHWADVRARNSSMVSPDCADDDDDDHLYG